MVSFTFIIVIEGLSAISSVSSIKLIWDSIPNTIGDIAYEIGIAIPQETHGGCNKAVYPEIYLTYLSTTVANADITDLSPGKCYLIGVRAHLLKGGKPGEWSVVLSTTKTLGE